MSPSPMTREPRLRRRRGLPWAAVVRVMCPGVELPEAHPLGFPQERQRRDRRTRARRVVVAPRRGRPAGDPLRPSRCVDTRVDRVADLRVGGRRRHPPLAADALELGLKEHGAVRLVPGEPLLDPRQDPPGRRVEERAAVATRRGVGELAEGRRGARRVLAPLSAVRPRGRTDDRQQHLHPRPARAFDRPVVAAPFVRRVGWIGWPRRTIVRDSVAPAPGERHAHDLDVQRLQGREGGLRRAEHRRVVEKTDRQVPRGRRRAGDGQGDDGAK